MRALLVACLLVASVLAIALPGARAAESYDNCTGYLTRDPVQITTQGTWCLRADLPHTWIRQNMITVQANNVTIDCKGFRLGAVAGGGASPFAFPISGSNLRNFTLRNCEIHSARYVGVSGEGIVIEDNLVVGAGIAVSSNATIGAGNVVRRNRVFDFFGSPDDPYTSYPAIAGDADFIDNVISDLGGEPAFRGTYVGIRATGAGNVVRGNRISGLHASDVSVTAIEVAAPGVMVVGNHIVADPGANPAGVRTTGTGTALCADNTAARFVTPFANCIDLGGNVSH